MIKIIFNRLLRSLWKIFALAIIVLAVGPNFAVGMELMAFVNVIGIDFFVLMYVAGILLYLEPAKEMFKKYWEIYFSMSESSSLYEDFICLKLSLFRIVITQYYFFFCAIALSAGLYWLTVEMLLIA